MDHSVDQRGAARKKIRNANHEKHLAFEDLTDALIECREKAPAILKRVLTESRNSPLDDVSIPAEADESTMLREKIELQKRFFNERLEYAARLKKQADQIEETTNAAKAEIADIIQKTTELV